MRNLTILLSDIENLMRNLTILLSGKLQKCWMCRHTFMANSPLAAIGDRVAHPVSKQNQSPGRVSKRRLSEHKAEVLITQKRG
jgi:hypothetical protein